MKLSQTKKIGLALFTCALLAPPPMALDGSERRATVIVIGIDDVGGRSLYNNAGVTPNMDAIMDQGVKFTNFVSAPTCTPARASFQTGEPASSLSGGHDLGRATTKIGEIDSGKALDLAKITIPEMLELAAGDDYQCGIVGKYHMEVNSLEGGSLTHPLDQGYDYAYVTEGNIQDDESYYDFEVNDNGTLKQVTEYCTEHMVQKAIDWVQSQPIDQPVFLNLETLVTHLPVDILPPAHLTPVSSQILPPNYKDDRRGFQHAALEAIDTEVERLRDALIASGHFVEGRDHFIIKTDNGDPNLLRDKAVIPKGVSKKTVYTPGVLCGLVIDGPAVATMGSECDALVSVTDLFATIADMAGADLSLLPSNDARDSLSLMSLLADPSLDHRDHVFAERFVINHENTGLLSAADGSFKDAGFGSGESLSLDVFGENGPYQDGDKATFVVQNAKPNKIVRFYIGYTNAGNNGFVYKDIIISVYPWEIFNKDHRADANGNLTVTGFDMPIAPPGTELFVQATVRWSKHDWEASEVRFDKSNCDENSKRVENDDYVYIRHSLHPTKGDGVEEFFDKAADPHTLTNLVEAGMPALTPTEQANFNELQDLCTERWEQ